LGDVLPSLLNLLVILTITIVAAPVFAVENPEAELPNASISFNNGASVDGALLFVNAEGREVRVEEMSQGLPLVVVPMYYGCPRLCGLVARGIERVLTDLGLSLGTDFRIASISFDETEKPSDAARAQAAAYKRLGISSGWDFYVGSEENIRRFMGQLGFGYQRDGKDFSHSAALILLTPQGQISQYFTGIEFSPRDLRLALVEASSGRIGNVIDHVLLFCFRFDPTQGKYTWAVVGLLRVVGVATLLGFLALFVFVRRWQQRASRIRG